MRYVAFLRAINVGGRNKLPMAAVRARLAELGYTDVATYIQSGNIVLTSAKRPAAVETELTAALSELGGFPVPTCVLDRAAYAAVVAGVPWPADDAGQLHVIMFPGGTVPADVRAALDEVETPDPRGDELVVGEHAVYLLMRGGLHDSKLATRVVRLAPTGTARNRGTVERMAALLEA